MRAPGQSRLVVSAGPVEAAVEACRIVLDAERAALARSGTFRIALSGGSTPRGLYAGLARSADATFARWQVFFGDERWVPAGHPDSNARMARETLLDHVAIPAHQVHVIDTGAGSPAKAAELYTRTLRRALAPQPGELPRFDLVHLGLGSDGHTASLFPGSTALDAAPGEIVVATWAPGPRAWRITLNASVINAARTAMFLVCGPDKAAALTGVIAGDRGLPAARVRPQAGELVFVADEAAASGVEVGLRESLSV